MKDGFLIGVKNIGPILVNLILWVLTCWIPYLNVGTTIGMFAGIIAKAAHNETIPMTEIFNKKYRQYMGEFFLTTGLVCIGIMIGCVFLFIPGIVIGLSWMFAILLTIDKGKNPSEAISLSNKSTYGNKGRIFCVLFLIGTFFLGLCIIFALIPVVGVILAVAVFFFCMFAMIGIQASLYKQLADHIPSDIH